MVKDTMAFYNYKNWFCNQQLELFCKYYSIDWSELHFFSSLGAMVCTRAHLMYLQELRGIPCNRERLVYPNTKSFTMFSSFQCFLFAKHIIIEEVHKHAFTPFLLNSQSYDDTHAMLPLWAPVEPGHLGLSPWLGSGFRGRRCVHWYWCACDSLSVLSCLSRKWISGSF